METTEALAMAAENPHFPKWLRDACSDAVMELTTPAGWASLWPDGGVAQVTADSWQAAKWRNAGGSVVPLFCRRYTQRELDAAAARGKELHAALRVE
jgi:hypothetical protein